ncbi:MAG: ATP-binding protein [Bacteroidales bacterium]|nr:ATP-binding protein [Bacteroidales bacterium]
MKFYNRTEELALLEQIRKRSNKTAQMTVLIGRRRIGKTKLILKSLENKVYLYFFVARKSEQLLCYEFTEEIKKQLKIPVFGTISEFREVFALLMEYAKTNPLNLIIDEFQEFANINPAIYSEMQKIWDLNKENAKINLIVSGSIYSLMKKIFENSKEALFGRATERIYLKPFTIETLKQIIKENNPAYSKKDLLAFYILTGGVHKYVELFTDKKALSFNEMLNELFHPNAYLLNEGKNILIEEFGKEYAVYFSILSLIASSKTARNEIESILERNIGGYLDRLENEYGIIKKIRPIFSKQGSRTVKYKIEDNFLNFWFRFVYRNQSAIEIENFDSIKSIVKTDFDTFSGRFLKKYFTEKLSSSKKYDLIGNYWERGNKNEIDIIAVNKKDKKALIAEVKLNKKKISIDLLKAKSEKLVQNLKGYDIEYKGFSIEDM